MKLRIVIVLALLLAAVVPGVAAAGSARPAVVAGEYSVIDFGTTSCVPLDDVRLRCRTTGLKSLYTGDLAGMTTSDLEQVIDCAAGRTLGHGVETFTGSLRGGRAGTLSWRLVFSADFDCTLFFPSRLRIVALAGSGTGGLAGVHGLLFFDDTTYHGRLL